MLRSSLKKHLDYLQIHNLCTRNIRARSPRVKFSAPPPRLTLSLSCPNWKNQADTTMYTYIRLLCTSCHSCPRLCSFITCFQIFLVFSYRTNFGTYFSLLNIHIFVFLFLLQMNENAYVYFQIF